MSKLIDTITTRLAKQDHERAIAALVAEWQRSPAVAVAEAVDAIDALAGGQAFTGNTKAWLAAAKTSTRHVERGPLLRAIAGRTAADTCACLAAAKAWRDPRLTHVLHELLVTLPWAGRRSVATWRPVFELVAAHGDPRTRELATTLPQHWKVGDLQKWLTNRLGETVAAIAEVPTHRDADALRTLTARPPTKRAGAPANEAELLAAIYAQPDDDAPRLVYADWLQERGDPRGEFIALQLQPDKDAAMAKRERALLKPNAKRWLGPLAGALRGEVEYRRGFPAKSSITFRNQRDAEQHALHPAWGTLEDLTWTSPEVPFDQVSWSRFIDPVMHGLRVARNPWPATLLAASRPWRLQRLEIEAESLGRDGLHAVLASSLLPELRALWVYGWGIEPSWLAGVKRIPPQFEINTSLDDDTLPTWLKTVAALPIKTFTLHGYPRYVARFTRENPKAPFTRLEVEVELYGRDKLTPVPSYVNELIADLKALPAKSLSHFSATTMLGGTRVTVDAAMSVGLKKRM